MLAEFSKHNQTRLRQVDTLLENFDVRAQALQRITDKLHAAGDDDIVSDMQATGLPVCDNPLAPTLALAIEQLPLPFWIKADDGRIIYLNHAYIEQYGEYIGFTDAANWERTIAAGFNESDETVKRTGKCLFTTEPIAEGLLLQVVKYPMQMGNELRIAVAGLGLGMYRLTE